MSRHDPTARDGEQTRREITRLRSTLEVFETERERLSRRRYHRLLTIGVGVSVVLHMILMWYLATQYRFGPRDEGPEPVNYEFAILQEEELTELESTRLDEPLPELAAELDDMPEDEPAIELEPAVSAAELNIADDGAMPALGGSGEGTGSGLAGGGAGTSFFGVSSRGMRFAYIVDRSGSMRNPKLQIAMGELARSVETLPDYASFFVLLFSDDYVQPPMQRGWMRAQGHTISRFIRWLNEIDPTGGTEPVPAFQRAFALEHRPDVIFFLTDGQIPDKTADIVAEMNRRGARVVVNTIAFGDPTSQDLLQRIADESGGTYRFVSTEIN